MAICDICNQEMRTRRSCSLKTLVVGGRRRNRILFGEEKLWEGTPGATAEHCWDCAVTRSGFHHSSCEVEECMVCGGQLLSCDCE